VESLRFVDDSSYLLKKVGRISMKTAALAVLFFLLSCDASDEQASPEIAVRWLNDYASRVSEESEFRISPIRLKDKSKIDMDVVITNP